MNSFPASGQTPLRPVVAPLRLGLVGLGKIATDQHLPAIAGEPAIALVAVADPANRTCGVPTYSDMAAMLDAHPEIEVVALCTPPKVRVGLARAALARGRHVLLEKPPAAAPTQLTALAGLFEAAGRTLYAAWHSRESAVVETAREWLAGRRVTGVRITWHEDVREWHPGQDWLLAAGGFGIFDPAINAFSILTTIIGQPVSVERAALKVPENRQSPIAALVDMQLADGTPVHADLDFLHLGPPQWDMVIETDGATLTLHRGGHEMIVDGEVLARSADDEYARIYRHLAELVRAGAHDVDPAPLQIVADAMLLGHAERVEAFEW